MFEAIIFVWLLTADEKVRSGSFDYEISYSELQPTSLACDEKLDEMAKKVWETTPSAEISGLCINRDYNKD